MNDAIFQKLVVAATPGSEGLYGSCRQDGAPARHGFARPNGQNLDRGVPNMDNEGTTLPLHGHLVGFCSGRKNRPHGGFFISSLRKST